MYLSFTMWINELYFIHHQLTVYLLLRLLLEFKKQTQNEKRYYSLYSSPHPPHQRSLWWIINKKKCLSVAWKNLSQPYYCSTWNLWKEEENWDEKNSRLSIISAQSLFHPSAHSTAECYSVTDDEERLSRFANCGRWKMSGVVLQHQGWKGEK